MVQVNAGADVLGTLSVGGEGGQPTTIYGNAPPGALTATGPVWTYVASRPVTLFPLAPGATGFAFTDGPTGVAPPVLDLAKSAGGAPFAPVVVGIAPFPPSAPAPVGVVLVSASPVALLPGDAIQVVVAVAEAAAVGDLSFNFEAVF